MAKSRRQSSGGSFGGPIRDTVDYTKVKLRRNDGMDNEPLARISKQKNQGRTQQISDPDSVHTYGKNFRKTITASARSKARKGAIQKAYI